MFPPLLTHFGCNKSKLHQYYVTRKEICSDPLTKKSRLVQVVMTWRQNYGNLFVSILAYFLTIYASPHGLDEVNHNLFRQKIEACLVHAKLVDILQT